MLPATDSSFSLTNSAEMQYPGVGLRRASKRHFFQVVELVTAHRFKEVTTSF